MPFTSNNDFIKLRRATHEMEVYLDSKQNAPDYEIRQQDLFKVLNQILESPLDPATYKPPLSFRDKLKFATLGFSTYLRKRRELCMQLHLLYECNKDKSDEGNLKKEMRSVLGPLVNKHLPMITSAAIASILAEMPVFEMPVFEMPVFEMPVFEMPVFEVLAKTCHPDLKLTKFPYQTIFHHFHHPNSNDEKEAPGHKRQDLGETSSAAHAPEAVTHEQVLINVTVDRGPERLRRLRLQAEVTSELVLTVGGLRLYRGPETLWHLRQQASVTPELALIDAASDNDPETLRSLLLAGVDIEAEDSDGWTALIAAAAEDSDECLTILLDHNANTEHENKYDSKTPLMYAAENNSVRSLEILLKKGAEMEHECDCEIKYRHVKTAFCLAACKSNYDCLNILAHYGANINYSGGDARTGTAYHLAVEKKDIMLIGHLKELGADPDLGDGLGMTPLMVAAAHYAYVAYFTFNSDAHVACIKALIKADADLEAQCRDHKTALVYAAESLHKQCLDKQCLVDLIKAGAEIVDVDDEMSEKDRGLEPSSISRVLAEALDQAGAEFYNPFLEQVNMDNEPSEFKKRVKTRLVEMLRARDRECLTFLRAHHLQSNTNRRLDSIWRPHRIGELPIEIAQKIAERVYHNI